MNYIENVYSRNLLTVSLVSQNVFFVGQKRTF